MTNLAYASQSSWNLDEYLPAKLSSEDALIYQSSEGLIRSFQTCILTSAHRIESEIFNPIIDDPEALLALIDNELLAMDIANSAIDDTFNYFTEQSTVIPHIGNLSNESQLYGSLPSSPSAMIMFENQQSKTSSPCSPLSPDRDYKRKFLVYDRTTNRERRPYLHEFMRLALENEEYSDIIQFIDRKQGIFKLHKPNAIAELWKYAKGRSSGNKMTYDKLARALRYYYSNGILQPTPGRFTFRFGSKTGFGTTWCSALN